MPMTTDELKFYKSEDVNDLDDNGGRMSAVEMVSGALQNLFPAIGQTERTNGSLKYRKLFAKVANENSLVGYNAQLFLDKNTEGGDNMVFFPATQNDTQGDIGGSVNGPRVYGGGVLNASASALDNEIEVLIEDENVMPFEIGDVMRITNKEEIDSEDGTEETVEITYLSAVGNVVTIRFTPELENDYLSYNSRAMSVYEPGDVEATADNLVATTAGSGDVDINEIVLNAIGTVEQVWTLDFTSSNAFTITGDGLGEVDTGTVAGGAEPNNPDFTEPYFTIPPEAFSGVFTAGDTVVFQTHPAAVPVWVRREVPAGTGTIAASTGRLVLSVEAVE